MLTSEWFHSSLVRLNSNSTHFNNNSNVIIVQGSRGPEGITEDLLAGDSDSGEHLVKSNLEQCAFSDLKTYILQKPRSFCNLQRIISLAYWGARKRSLNFTEPLRK